MIDPTAIIHPQAELGTDVKIGPYCVIGAGVVIGDRCHLHHHASISGPAIIGEENEFFPFACIGERTQDLKYEKEPTYLKIGNRNTFREFCTVHRSDSEDSVTQIGNDCNFLAYSHIAHDCTVGNHVIFSNNGTLAGHVTVEDHAIIGGLSAVHQFCRVGSYAIIGGYTKIVQDVPPYTMADGNPAAVRGINKIGLQRHGFTVEEQRALKLAYKLLYRSKLHLGKALEEVQQQCPPLECITKLVQFIQQSQRGLTR